MPYFVTKDLGQAAVFTLKGFPGNNVILFPDGKIQPCKWLESFYNEKECFLVIDNTKVLLEPGYDPEIQGRRKVKIKGRNVKVSIKLLPRTDKDKENGIYPVKIESMTI